MADVEPELKRSLSRSSSRSHESPSAAPKPSQAGAQAKVPPEMEAPIQNISFTALELQQTTSFAASEPPPKDYRSIERDPLPGADEEPESLASRRRLVGSKCRYFQTASCAEHVGYFCALSVSAYLGILARIYLTELAAWNGLPLFPAFYSEVVGTAIMGAVLTHKQLLEKTHKLTYQALATGLCGSITTFSSWNNDAASVLIQYGKEDPNNITRAIGWATILIVGFGMPIAALRFGQHVGYLSPWADQRTGEKMHKIPNRTRITITFEVVGYIIVWVACNDIGCGHHSPRTLWQVRLHV